MRLNSKKIIKNISSYDDRTVNVASTIVNGIEHSVSVNISSVKTEDMQIFSYDQDDGKDNIRMWVSAHNYSYKDIELIEKVFKENFDIYIKIYIDNNCRDTVYAYTNLFGHGYWVSFSSNNWVGFVGEYDRKTLRFNNIEMIKYEDIPQNIIRNIEHDQPVGVIIPKTQW